MVKHILIISISQFLKIRFQVHNGIILNTDDLIKKFVNKTSSININLEDSDSFLFCKLIDYLFSIDNNHFNNFTKIASKIKGSYSIAE